MNLAELDQLIGAAEKRRVQLSRETELDRLRKELVARIVSSGYSFEEIFGSVGRFPQGLLRRLDQATA